MAKSRNSVPRKPSHRNQELDAAVKEFFSVHQAWVDDENRENPDATYEDAVVALCEIFEHGDMPHAYSQLNDKVTGLGEQWDLFVDSGKRYPDDNFWGSVEAVEKAWKHMQAPTLVDIAPLEPIADLRKQGVPDRQIAKMWGFMTEAGHPLVALVEKEFLDPGSVTRTPGAVAGKDWIDPRLKEMQEANEEIQEFAENLVQKHKAAEKVASSSCPETVEELFLQGVSAKQAAKMLGQREDDVAAEFERMQEARDAQEKEQAKGDKPVSLRAKKKPGKADPNQAIYDLADQNVTPANIAKQLKLGKRVVDVALKKRQKVEA